VSEEVPTQVTVRNEHLVGIDVKYVRSKRISRYDFTMIQTRSLARRYAYIEVDDSKLY